MIEVIPLYPCVHTDAYTGILNILGEDVAHQLLYDPREVTGNDRSDYGVDTETVEGWLRSGIPDIGAPVATEAPEEPAAKCP